MKRLSLDRWIDIALVALIGAAVGGRIGHVLLNWDTFAGQLDEAMRLNAGGVDWHGAVIGALIVGWIAARIRRIPFSHVLAVCAPIVPLIALASWIMCGSLAGSACMYGAEVNTLANYPPLVVRELPDVYGIVAPRWNTPLFGIVGSTLIFALIVWLSQRAMKARYFWLALALTGLQMLMIGFVRGDSVIIGGLRADMVLSAGMILIGTGFTRLSK